MGNEQQDNSKHDLKALADQFPDLSPEKVTTEEQLKALETKYNILLQIADQQLRDRELRLKEDARKVDRWANPLVVGIFAGALGLVGTFVNGVISNRNQHIQLENELIKEAIKPGTEQERAKSLVFFAKNGLISIADRSLDSLIKIAGSDQPVPGSSTAVNAAVQKAADSISYNQTIVERIRAKPGVSYPAGAVAEKHLADTTRKAIILHDAFGGDNIIGILRTGREGLPGPLAHWAVKSDGSIAYIANETVRALHVGRAARGISNSNSIGIEVTGTAALKNEAQFESLIRLVADVADRWNIPTAMIFSHAEVSIPLGRKVDMKQQAPIVRQMVAEVRGEK